MSTISLLFDVSDKSMASAEIDDEIEALREIWQKQGVGKEGFLTFEELGTICENMGMDKMLDEVREVM